MDDIEADRQRILDELQALEPKAADGSSLTRPAPGNEPEPKGDPDPSTATGPANRPVDQGTWQNAMGLPSTVDEYGRDTSQPEQMNASFVKPGAVAADIGQGVLEAPRAVAHGIIGAVNNTIGAVNAGGDYLDRKLGGPELFNDKGGLDPSWQFSKHQGGFGKAPNIDAPKSVSAGFLDGAVEFTVGMLGAAKFTKLGGFLGAAVNSGIAGATTMDPNTKRLSNLIQQVPSLQNPITDFLKQDTEDPELLARLKNGLENAGLGTAAEGVVLGIRFLRATKVGDKALAETVGKELEANQNTAVAAEEVKSAETQASSSPPTDAVPPAGEIPEQPGGTPVAGIDPASSPTPTVDPEAPVPMEPEVGIAGQPEQPVANDPIASQQTASIDDPAIASTPTVDEPTVAPEAVAPEAAPSVTPLVDAGSEGRQAITQAITSDFGDAITKYGSIEAAQKAGWSFADSTRLDYGKLTDADDFAKVVADVSREVTKGQAEALRGGDAGGVQTWDAVRADANKLAATMSVDPNILMGNLHRDALEAPEMSARITTYGLLLKKVRGDLVTLAKQYVAGDPGEYGDMATLAAKIDDLSGLHADVQGSFEAVVGNTGRALNVLKMLRSEDAAAYYRDGWKNIGEFARVVAATGEDDAGLAGIIRKHFEANVWGNVGAYYRANLLWNPTTHLANIAGNTVMAMTAPLNKIIGGALTGRASDMLTGASQYVYLATTIGDAVTAAYKSFRLGRSILDDGNSTMAQTGKPAAAELMNPAGPGASNVEAIGRGLINWLWQGSQLPFRALSAEDDFFKQLLAGSSVKADAFVDGVQKGMWRDWDGLNAHISQQYRDMADPTTGALTNAKALDEARIGTFTQDWDTSTSSGRIGKGIQQIGNDNPLLSILVAPFVKTPFQIGAQVVRWTPGLNVLSKSLRGRVMSGDPAQVSSALGEMGTGMLIFGSAIGFALNGKIVGHGPTDPAANKAWQDLGNRPYSFVIHNSDGSKSYVPFQNVAPVGTVMGIAADLASWADELHRDKFDGDLGDAATAVFMALAGNAKNMNFLDSMFKGIEALDRADSAPQAINNYIGSIAAGFVPGSSGVRFADSYSDPYLREARGVMDHLMQILPGQSQKLPMRVNAWGEPVTIQSRLGSIRKADVVSDGIEQAIQSSGHFLAAPDPKISAWGQTVDPSTGAAGVHGVVDTRNIVLSDGSNAFDKYMEYLREGTHGNSMRDAVQKAMESSAFERLNDGGEDEAGSKLRYLSALRRSYLAAARAQLVKNHPEVQQALQAARDHAVQVNSANKQLVQTP